jgi:hypothetical protein
MGRRRGALILAALYGLPAAVWLFAALVREAYHYRNVPLLNRLFPEPTLEPVAHGLTFWRTYCEGPTLVWLIHLVIVLTIMAANHAQGESPVPAERHTARMMDWWLAGLSLIFLVVSLVSGPQDDYYAFLQEWDRVNIGDDPWWIPSGMGYSPNTYGPLFNVLAPAARWHPLAPKLLFALAHSLFTVWLVKQVLASGESNRNGLAWGLLAWLMSPYAWIEVAYLGHFDGLVAICCVASVAWFHRGRELLAGASLAVGFLLKLLPVVIVPFLAFDLANRHARVRVRLLLGALVPMTLGYALSCAVWGRSSFGPFRVAAMRPPNIISIYAYLGGQESPLRWFTREPDVSAWSTPCLVLAGLAVWLVCQRLRPDPETSAVAAVLTTLLFYKVGHFSYQMSLFLLMAFWMSLHAPELATSRGLAVAVGAYFGILTLAVLILFHAGATGTYPVPGPWTRLLPHVGLLMFLIGNYMLVRLMQASRATERRVLSGLSQSPAGND